MSTKKRAANATLMYSLLHISPYRHKTCNESEPAINDARDACSESAAWLPVLPDQR